MTQSAPLNDVPTPELPAAVIRNITLAQALPDCIKSRADHYTQLLTRQEWLAPRSCTGHEHWRDKDGPNPKLYINHKSRASCPIHGDPPANGRLRKYIGQKLENVADARNAIEFHTELVNVERQIRALGYTFSNLYSTLRSLFAEFGYLIDDEGRPQVDPDWNPGRRSIFTRRQSW